MKNDTVPDLLPHEIDAEDIIRKNVWKKRIKKTPKDLKKLEICKKLFDWGRSKKGAH
jgi:hypothetical protein